MNRFSLTFFFAIVLLLASCGYPDDTEEQVVLQTIVPGQEGKQEATASEDTAEAADIVRNSPQILIDRDYTVYEIRNANLDLDDMEEQVILASPLNEDRDVFKVYVADYNIQKDEYTEIYRGDVGENNLNLASIQLEDLTGDHYQEVIISGIDTKDQQIFKTFKLFPTKEDEQPEVKAVFSQAVDGDIEIIRNIRGNDYKIEKLKGLSFSLEVQKKNPDDDKNLIVERYKWNGETETYELGSSEKVRISSLSNENLLNFYRGSSSDYIEFLTGPWYKVKDLNGNPTHNMNEIFQLIPSERTLNFFSGNIQESFFWRENNEPVKYRHVLSFDVWNNILTSMYFPVSIYINSFNSIQVKIRGNQRWGGTYTQLTDNLQKALTDTSRENSLLSEMEIKGLYKSNLNTEIIFDSPDYILKEDGVESRGIYTLFELNGEIIMEMKELNSNGLTREVRTYRMEYGETSDDLRIIRTITLLKGALKSGGIAPESNSELHFEQIEKINQDITDNQS